MGRLDWFRQKDARLQELLEQHATLDVEGATELVALVTPGADIPRRAARIREIEHAADVLTHRCVETLHKAFSTSIERDDLHRLVSRMDDILDTIEAAAERVALYGLSEMTSDVRDLAAVVLRSAETVERGVRGLRDLKNAESLIRTCIEINSLENEADALLRSGMARLFKERDPMLVIKWKEIYELLETATDRCEDVANTLEGIVLEHA